jgi:hypothetical protein
MNILSVDWDYFFPPSDPYDWGHRETVLFLEMIWKYRVGCHNLFTKKLALDEYCPTIPDNFWKQVISNKPHIFIAESHASLHHIMNTVFKRKKIHSITNFDAHHDCGYGQMKTLECGNWGAFALRKGIEVHIRYPEWRKKEENSESMGSDCLGALGGNLENLNKPKNKQAEANTQRLTYPPTSISYGLPERPSDYSAIFVCRSGCWTPPWFDNKFWEFIKSSSLPSTNMDEYITKDRGIDIKEARRLSNEMLKQYAQLGYTKEIING